jgi:hypothetical protein
MQDIIQQVATEPSASATATAIITALFGFIIRLVELKHLKKCGKINEK